MKRLNQGRPRKKKEGRAEDDEDAEEKGASKNASGGI
jgi:hypothetical protein